MASLSLAERLARLPDPRLNQGKRHSLAAILRLVAAAVLCGMRSLQAIAQFGRELPPASVQELGFTHPTTPCKSTLSVVLRQVDATRLEAELGAWAQEQAAGDEQVAVDGKTLRGSADGESPAVHLLSVYAVASGVTLAQAAVGDKTNEHKAALELLRQVPLAGKVVSGDALFTHRDFCAAVLDGGGDYLLPAKDNQPTLLRDIRAAFTPEPGLSPPTTGTRRGRPAAGQRLHQGTRPPGKEDDPDDGAAQRVPGLAGGRPGLLAAAGADGAGQDHGRGRVRDHQPVARRSQRRAALGAAAGPLADRERPALRPGRDAGRG